MRAVELDRDARARGVAAGEDLLPAVPRVAVTKAVLINRATCRSFLRFFATHTLGEGSDIRAIEELFCHRAVETTMIDTHVRDCGSAAVRSPMDGR
jgi:hypothetical protein